ncbi:hypothetical protein [Streptomyces sp. NPDC088748]|uniref:hypothetical protein n=1 Tax=Streptomyces sp. NPDC088748 TaxID=3365887 RepID=UPI0037FAE9B2
MGGDLLADDGHQFTLDAGGDVADPAAEQRVFLASEAEVATGVLHASPASVVFSRSLS